MNLKKLWNFFLIGQTDSPSKPKRGKVRDTSNDYHPLTQIASRRWDLNKTCWLDWYDRQVREYLEPLSVEEILRRTKIECEQYEKFNAIRRNPIYTGSRWGKSTFVWLLGFTDMLLKTIADLQHQLYVKERECNEKTRYCYHSK